VWLRIDPESGVPIYRQIAAQIEQAVAAGFLAAGDRLPGVRELAVTLAVNPGTVVKAYEELRRSGVVAQPRGMGTFVAEVPRLAEAERRQRLEALAVSAAAEAARLGYTPADLCRAVMEARPAAIRDGGGVGDERGTR
jgi:GntR family transcriptional regulator